MGRSWKKHGSTAFEFSVLELVSDQSLLIEREQFWITKLKAADPRIGFNMSPTAGNCLGCKHTAATKSKMSKLRKGVKKSPEGAANIARVTTERNKSESMKLAVRLSKLKLYEDPKRREQLRRQAVEMWAARRARGPLVGWPKSDETRRKLSLAKKGKMTDSHKAAIAASNRNRVRTRTNVCHMATNDSFGGLGRP